MPTYRKWLWCDSCQVTATHASYANSNGCAFFVLAGCSLLSLLLFWPALLILAPMTIAMFFASFRGPYRCECCGRRYRGFVL